MQRIYNKPVAPRERWRLTVPRLVMLKESSHLKRGVTQSSQIRSFRKDSCTQISIRNKSKIWFVFPCIISVLSWKYHQNPFIRVVVMLLPDEQQTNTEIHVVPLFSSSVASAASLTTCTVALNNALFLGNNDCWIWWLRASPYCRTRDSHDHEMTSW